MVWYVVKDMKRKRLKIIQNIIYMISWINFEDKINLNILKILIYEMSKIESLQLKSDNRYSVEVKTI